METSIVFLALLILVIAVAYVCIRLTSSLATTLRDIRDDFRRFFP